MTVKAVTNKNSKLKGALAILKIKNKVKEEVMALRIMINVHRAFYTVVKVMAHLL
ncbi:hypothetical protein GQQ49_12785 [Klebsiella pneumoniae]|uniref:hypothetical protein n=1 Tax=Klebsiella pneumoniae TaxID=573 RepID=UPI001CA50371|nr:hypothetical protein [Klebsiella pneumoniae]MBW5608042.1 hypothetical protein [Klebsiella pneumoniae]HDZ8941798.1 hypothetical protein [Klebsiella pneumoniae]HDZ8944281.1 hypothetical protein [Klebsiella pneumoniae]